MVESGSIIMYRYTATKVEQEQELNRIDDTSRDINPYKELILKLVGILWNRTFVEVVDKLSSATKGFIRSEKELKNMHLYGV